MKSKLLYFMAIVTSVQFIAKFKRIMVFSIGVFLFQTGHAQLTPDVLYYKFNETGTNVTNNASVPPAGTTTATIMGGVTQGNTGQCGGALVGSGIASSTDYLNTNWVTDLGTGSWTISFWSSGISVSTDLYYIFGDATANSFRCFTNGVAGNNNWVLRGGGLTDVYLNGGALTTPTNNAFVYDATTNEVKAYLNGVLVSTVAQSTVDITGTGPFKVMGYSSNIGAPAGGLLDEFRVYRRALSDVEIAALVNLNNAVTDVVTACDSYTWIDGNTYTASNNTATYTLTNAAGCDSVVTLDLTINNSSTRTDVITAIDSYTWVDGNTYTASNNTATYTLTNAAGCDSVISLNLTILYTEVLNYKFNETGTSVTNNVPNPPAGAAIATTMGGVTQDSTGQCGGALVGSGLSASTDYLNTNWVTDLGTGSWTISFWSSGISANTTLYYIFGDASANSFRCFTNGVAGSNNWVLRGGGLTDVYLNGGALTTPTNNAFVYDATTNEVKAYLNGVLVNTVAQSIVDITGTGPFKVMGYSSNVGAPAGGLLDEFRVYRRALSDVEIAALVNLNSTGTDVVSACDSYTWIDGNTYTANNNTATFTLTNAAGCDSIVTLDLTIKNSTTGTDVISACDSYTWIDGNTYTASNNTATFTLTNAAGCDSIVTLDLTIKNSTTGTEAITACGSYTWIDGNTYTASNNTATFTLTNAAGCDSIVMLDLTINTFPDNTTSTNGATIIANESGAAYQWIDCDNGNAIISGETNQSYTATVNGNYAVIIDNGNCTDTSACVAITGLGVLENAWYNGVVVYPNPTNGQVTITFEKKQSLNMVLRNTLGQVIEERTVNNADKMDFQINAAPGVYFLELVNADNQRYTINIVKK